MAWFLPYDFGGHLEGKNINLVPLVTIESPSDTTESIYLSTHSISIDHVDTTNFPDPFFFKPLLLNVPNISESIDLNKRTHKVSNVTLSISNLPYEGIRFSDLILTEEHSSIPNSLINATINIQWKCPTSRHFTSFNPMFYSGQWEGFYLDLTYTNYYEQYHTENHTCLMVFSGSIRKYTHDDTKVTLTIEDRTELDLHQDLPIQNDTNWLSTDTSVPEKYRGKPKPMVYGYVDKSPCVLDANGQIVVDTKPIHSLIKRSHDVFGEYEPLYMKAGDKIVSVAKTVKRDLGSVIIPEVTEGDETLSGGDYVGESQWSHNNNGDNPADNIIQLNTFNPLVLNQVLQCDIFHKAQSVLLDDSSVDGNINIISEEESLLLVDNDYNTGTNLNITGTDSATYTSGNVAKKTFFSMRIGTKLSIEDSLESKTTSIAINSVKLPTPNKVKSDHVHELYIYPIEIESTESDYYSDTILIGTPHSLKETSPSGTEYDYNLTKLFGFTTKHNDGNYDYYVGGVYKDIDIHFTSPTGSFSEALILPALWFFDYCGMGDHEDAQNNGYYEILFRGHWYVGNLADGHQYEVEFTLENANINEVDVRSFVDIKNIYSKTFFATVKGRIGENLEDPPANGYLRQPREIITDIIRELKNDPYYETKNKALSSSYEQGFDHFINDFTVHKKIGSKKLIQNILSTTPFIGRFGFDGSFVFNELPSHGGILFNTIKEEDVINFSFSKTEDVYTKVIFKSKINYLTDEFEYVSEAHVSGFYQNYDYDYYGLPSDDSASTLVVDDDRGRYIRDKDASKRFANWLLTYYANPHLKLKIDLPLNYLNIEVGDTINFNQLIQGIKPYGINYVKEGQLLNGQLIFPSFIVTSTVKNLEKITIECVQNHHLWMFTCGSDSGFDCAGVCGGNAELDVCGVCDGGETNPENCVECPEDIAVDCLGVCGGDAVQDACGVCQGTCDGTPTGDCDYECGCSDIPEGFCDCFGNIEDCAGVCGGEAYLDNCGSCVGGTTNQPCYEDCFGEYGGTATMDEVCPYCTPEETDVDECWHEFYIKVNGNNDLHLRELTITFDLGNKMNFLKGGMIPLANGTLENPSPPDQVWQFPDNVWGGYRLIGGAMQNLANASSAYQELFANGRTRIYDTGDGGDYMSITFEVDDGLLSARSTPYHILRLPIERITSSPSWLLEELGVDYLGSTLDVNITDVKLKHQSLSGVVVDLHDISDVINYEKTQGAVSWSKFEGTEINKHIINVTIPDQYSNDGNVSVGDTNNDGIINVLDVVKLSNDLLESGGYGYYESGDMNGDGTLNVLDIVELATCVLFGDC